MLERYLLHFSPQFLLNLVLFFDDFGALLYLREHLGLSTLHLVHFVLNAPLDIYFALESFLFFLDLVLHFFHEQVQLLYLLLSYCLLRLFGVSLPLHIKESLFLFRELALGFLSFFSLSLVLATDAFKCLSHSIPILVGFSQLKLDYVVVFFRPEHDSLHFFGGLVVLHRLFVEVAHGLFDDFDFFGFLGLNVFHQAELVFLQDVVVGSQTLVLCFFFKEVGG